MRTPDRDFTPAPRRLREQQVGDVDASDEEHDADRAQQQVQTGPRPAGDLVLQRDERCEQLDVLAHRRPRWLFCAAPSSAAACASDTPGFSDTMQA